MKGRHQHLLRAVGMIVGTVSAHGSHCLAAAALALEASKHLRLDLRALAVALVIADPATGLPRAILAGKNVLDEYRGLQLDETATVESGFNGNAGHVALVSDRLSLMLDPSFGQVPEELTGIEEGVLCLTVEVATTRPTDEILHVTLNSGLVAAYVIKPDDQDELEQIVAELRTTEVIQEVGERVAKAARRWVNDGASGEPDVILIKDGFRSRPLTFIDLGIYDA